MARATNSCTPHGGLQGGRRESSLLTFAALLVTQKREKGKVFSNLFYKRHLIRQPTAGTFYPSLGDADRVCSANRSIPHGRRLSTRFLFCKSRRKRKSYQKEKRRYKDFALCGARQGQPALVLAAFPKRRAKTLIKGEKCVRKR